LTKWSTGYVDRAGERIYWESAGEGAPIIVCHGAGSNHVSFYQQMAGLASDRHQLVLWDQRGYGNSTFATGVFGLGVAADDLTAVLAAVGLADAPVHVVGQAMGGLVAATWAVANAGRVLTLALWDGPFAAVNQGRELAWMLEPDDRGVAATQTGRQVSQTRAVGAAFTERDPVGTYLYQTIQELGNARPTYAQVFAAAQSEPVSIAALRALEIPIALGRGEHDHVSDAAALDEIASLIPGATTVTLPGCGHSPYFEDPGQWNAAVRTHVAAGQR
jgi:3-oxoadipate enol-lactonase